MRIRTLVVILGFLLFIVGMMAILLSIVGVQLVFLVWMDNISPLFGFLGKLFMMLGGLILIVLFRARISDRPAHVWPEDIERESPEPESKKLLDGESDNGEKSS